MIYCSYNSSFFILDNNAIKVAGENYYKQFGIGALSSIYNSITDGMVLPNIKSISNGFGQHVLYVMNDGTVKGIGRNNVSQLGPLSGSTVSELTDMPISNVKSAHTTMNSTFFLLNDGTVKGCGTVGAALGGYVAAGTIKDMPITGVKSIITTLSESIFIMEDNTVKGCGSNTKGTLGLGNKTSQTNIVTIPITDVKYAFSGEQNLFYLLNDGTVKGVGYNIFGQLGIGNEIDQTSIVTIGITGIKQEYSPSIPQYNIRTGNFTLADQDLIIEVNLL